MIRYLLLVVWFLGASFNLLAVDPPKYPVSEIPDSLRKNSDLVYRVHNAEYEILNEHSMIYREFKAVTVLNSAAKDEAVIAVFYDKLSKVTKLEARIYDAQGNFVRKVRQAEIFDQSATGNNLYTDDRVKIVELLYPQYPYTFEIEYEVSRDFLFFSEEWFVPAVPRSSVQASSFTVRYPLRFEPRVKLYNKTKEPIRELGNYGAAMMQWNFKNVPAIENEPFSLGFSEITRRVSVAPNQFEFSGYSGNMKTWNDFGQWIGQLSKDRTNISEKTAQEVRRLADGFPTQEEKVKAIYQYLQNRTRYVSVQIGIGGFQPFPASFVDEKGYGDCKALSNYMVSLLSAAGIKSNYVLIRAGDEERTFDTSFPANYFNHATVAVPMAKDTLWLECTSQDSPFAFAGTFTGNRKALMITDQGAKVVNTVRYSLRDNTAVTLGNVAISETGQSEIKTQTVFRGLWYDLEHLGFVVNFPPERQRRWFANFCALPSYDVKQFELRTNKERIPEASLTTHLLTSSMATKTGSRLFITPGLYTNVKSIRSNKKRISDLVFEEEYSTEMKLEIVFPVEYVIESLPAERKIDSPFATYTRSYETSFGKLTYHRRMIYKRGRFGPEKWKEYADFLRACEMADRENGVLVKKT